MEASRLPGGVAAQAFEPVGKVRGKRGSVVEGLVRDRVGEGQVVGVQCLPRGSTTVGLGLRNGCGMRVSFLAAEGVADFGEVDPDLVSAAGLEAALEDGVVADALDGADVGDGVLGGGVVLPPRTAAAQAVAAVADEIAFDGLLGGVAVDDGEVGAVDGVRLKHLRQRVFGGGRKGEDHQAAGVAVEAVDGADLWRAGVCSRWRSALARPRRPAAL